MDEIKIELSDEVQAAIEQVLQSEDPLDKLDFNTTEYINRLFPNEIALNGIDEIINKVSFIEIVQRLMQVNG